jgi:hypothetical protein
MPPGPSVTWTPWAATCRRSGARPPPRRPGRPRAALLRSVLWYGLLSLVLLMVWAMSGRDYFWPIWPILGFALLLGWQAFNVLGPEPSDRGRRRDRDR